jgi:UDP-N-acetylglucosamine 2-epimerase (non-hydrolysing)
MKILVIAGARPNFMKVAPILQEFRRRARHSVLFVHTGQHYDRQMSQDFFDDLDLPPPDLSLGVGSGSHAEQTARVMMLFEPVCVEHQPDWVVVVGDVNSTLACALCAKKLNIRVAHVEAGLRSGDMSMPEEINRICTDAISDLLFTTDHSGNDNLRKEGISSTRVQLVGNTMIDTLLKHLDRALMAPLPPGAQPRSFALMTLHRPANVDSESVLRRILGAVQCVARTIPIVFPAHPRTMKNLSQFGLLSDLERNRNVLVIEPVNYLRFIGMLARCRMVLTDSGGIQEESTFLKIPCLTMRENTERPITCSLGTNVLVGTDAERIIAKSMEVLTGRTAEGRVPSEWDGRAGERIVDCFDSISSQ